MDLGALGVGFFFLLSGLVIAISLDRYSRRGFLVGWCMRLLPTYAAGYAITCAVIAAVGDPRHELHPSSVAAGLVPGVQFLVGVAAPGDGIVWTLIIEMVFYAVCLVGFRTLTRRWEAIAAVALGCVVTQLLVAPPSQLVGSPLGGLRYLVLLAAPFLPVMLIGVALSSCSRGQIRPAAAGILVPGLAATHFWLLWNSHVVPTSLQYKLTFLAVIALFCLFWGIGNRWRRNALAESIASISYPLYVVHPVLGYAMLSLLVEHHVRVPLAILATVGTVTLVAWVVHRVVEVPTHHLGRRWARSCPSGAATAAPPVGADVPVGAGLPHQLPSRADGSIPALQSEDADAA